MTSSPPSAPPSQQYAELRPFSRRPVPDLVTKLSQMRKPLSPLYSLGTGTVHPDFPRSILHFWLLTDEQLEGLAVFYHQKTPGPLTEHYPCPVAWPPNLALEEKRRRIGRFIGLKGCDTPRARSTDLAYPNSTTHHEMEYITDSEEESRDEMQHYHHQQPQQPHQGQQQQQMTGLNDHQFWQHQYGAQWRRDMATAGTPEASPAVMRSSSTVTLRFVTSKRLEGCGEATIFDFEAQSEEAISEKARRAALQEIEDEIWLRKQFTGPRFLE